MEKFSISKSFEGIFSTLLGYNVTDELVESVIATRLKQEPQFLSSVCKLADKAKQELLEERIKSGSVEKWDQLSSEQQIVVQQLYFKYVSYNGSYVPKNSTVLDFKRTISQELGDEKMTQLNPFINFSLFHDYFVKNVERDELMNELRYINFD